jgi:hypothetical protein
MYLHNKRTPIGAFDAPIGVIRTGARFANAHVKGALPLTILAYSSAQIRALNVGLGREQVVVSRIPGVC